MESLLEIALTLFFTLWGFYIIGYAVGVFKQHPARALGRMIRATIKGTFWLLKVLIEASGQLIMALVHGAPADRKIGNGDQGKTAFLTGFDRWKLIRRRGHDGLVVDGRRRLSLERSMRGAAVIAPTGSGKTTSYLIVNALTLSSSAVITDPSGEIYKASAGWLHSQGYEIKVFNVADVSHSHFFNPLHRADNNHTAIGQLADTLIYSAFPESRDPFWNASAKSLIGVLIRCLKTQPPEYANLHNLRYLLNNFGQDASNLNSFISRTADEATFQEWKGVIATAPKVLASIVSTCKAALEKVADPAVARLTSTETLHFEELRRRRCVLYLITPEQETRYWSFITNLLIGQLFAFCMKPPRPGEPHEPILFLLDEFANQGRYPDFSVTASTIRKYSCSLSIVLQDVMQLERVYGKAEASSILNGGMTTKIFLPGLPQPTCEHLSRVLGKGEDGMPILTPDQIRTLPDSSGLLIHGNKKPVLLDMVPFYKSRKLLTRSRIPPPPLPESDTSTELHYVPLGRKNERKKKHPKVKTSDTQPNAEDVGGAPAQAAEAVEPLKTLSPTSATSSTTQKTERSDSPHSVEPNQRAGRSERDHSRLVPPWVGEILEESRRAREEVEILRESIGVHTVTRKEAARILGKSTKTLKRWEDKGILKRVEVSAPGVHYDYDSVLKLKQECS